MIQRIKAAIDFMKGNLHRSIKLSELAEHVHVSQSHLSYLFKRHAEISPIDYLIRLRMQAAQRLLSTTFLSVKEIIAAVGYGNRGSFLRQFRRYSNTTPTAYRIHALTQR